jgi:hypothetical protein
MIVRATSESPRLSLESGRRLLTLIPASAIVISSMVGTGILATTGLMAAMGAAGGDILVAWMLAESLLCAARFATARSEPTSRTREVSITT